MEDQLLFDDLDPVAVTELLGWWGRASCRSGGAVLAFQIDQLVRPIGSKLDPAWGRETRLSLMKRSRLGSRPMWKSVPLISRTSSVFGRGSPALA